MSSLQVLHVKPGEDVYSEGDTGESVYTVSQGELGVFVSSKGGLNAEQLRLDTLRRGDVFGEVCVLGGKRLRCLECFLLSRKDTNLPLLIRGPLSPLPRLPSFDIVVEPPRSRANQRARVRLPKCSAKIFVNCSRTLPSKQAWKRLPLNGIKNKYDCQRRRLESKQSQLDGGGDKCPC